MTTANVFPDTALLLSHQGLDTLDWEQLYGVDRVTILVAPVVLRELSRLKNQAGRPPQAERAVACFDQVVRLLRLETHAADPVVFKTVQDPSIDFEAERLDPSNPRDQLVATIIDFQQTHALEYVVLLTDDPETVLKAERAGIDVERLSTAMDLPAHEPASVSSASAPTGGDGMAPRQSTDGHEASAPDRIVPLDGLMERSPLYKKLPEPKLPSLPPIPVARRPSPTLSVATTTLPEAFVHLPSNSEPVRRAAPPAPPPAPPVDPESVWEAPSRPGYVEMYSADSAETVQGATNESALHAQADTAAGESFTATPPHGPTLTRTVPELRLAYNDGAYRSTALIRSPIFPSIDELTQELTRIRRDHPKLAYLKPAPGEETVDPRRLPIYERKNQRIKRYNAALDAYYAATEKYLHDVSEFANMNRRRTVLALSLINDAPVVLKSLYITVRFASNVRIFSDDHLPDQPIPPEPPARPNLDALFDAIRLPIVPVPSELRQPSNLLLRSRSLSPLEIRWNKGWDVIYSIRELERSHAVSFNPLYLVFNSFDKATSIRIPYRITVASSTQEERGQLELLVRKVIQ
ncbi:MAG: PIN domain-containing protein [Rhodothermales bacterium]|nr:PIN domain-containing protein [Rhodothermales bacterium]